MKKIYTEKERKEARKKSVKKYNDKNKDRQKKLYQDNKKDYQKRNKKYYLENKSKIKTKTKEYANANREKIINNKKTYYENNKKYFQLKNAKYSKNNKDAKRKYDKIYRKLNIEKINLNKRSYKKERRLIDHLYKLKLNIGRSISDALRKKGFTKKSRSFEILGCSFEQLKAYLEFQFESWMCWENHGKYNGTFNYGWDIDHIIPLATAKTEKEIIRLNHYTNLQPLCSHKNRNIKKDNSPF